MLPDPVAVLLALLATAGPTRPRPDHRLADAAERQDCQAVAALLKQGADANGRAARRRHGAPLGGALGRSRRRSTCCSRAGANVNAANDHGVTPLALACENGNAAIVEKLLGGRRQPQRRDARPEKPP